MISENYWKFLSFIVALHFLRVFVNGEIFTHLGQCCETGTKYAVTKTHCLDYEQTIENIPAVWRGLCLSTFGMCCSKELRNQHCIAGRNAAKVGTNCEISNKFNSTAYTECCKACQIGLAVATSGHNCSSNNFSYIIGDESYKVCCNDFSDDNDHPHPSDHNPVEIDNAAEENGNENTFFLEDGDICGQLPKLCSHICENTRDSYVCKCHEGYKLDENQVTCSMINKTGFDEEVVEDVDEDLSENGDDEDDERSCKKGFIKNPQTDECLDIDECAMGHKCQSDQYCFNTKGGYNCLNIKSTTCQSGYRFNAKIEKCEDIDECLDNPCGEDVPCVNMPGGYECRKLNHDKLPLRFPVTSSRQTLPDLLNEPKCEPGYRFKNNQCQDIDECLTDKNACDSNQICTNEQGGYRCDCKIGFKMDSTLNACVDINECQINNHNCLPSQRCDNTIGAYTCIRLQSCGTGYTLNAESGNCDDDNECELGTHNCPPEYDCRNTMGSFKCDRRRYSSRRVLINRGTSTSTYPSISTSQNQSLTSTTTPTTTSTTTTTTTTTPPPPTPTATTSPTTIRTISTSQTPFTPSRSPYYPSYYPSRQYPYTTLTTRIGPGSYVSSQTSSQFSADYNPSTVHHRFKLPTESSCPYGFRRNSYGACVDVNECDIPNACGSHQRCINLNGSYKCQNLLSCPGGFRASNDGKSCLDIDECQTGEHNCGRDQTCRNKQGGYICQCPPGHSLSGTSCVDVNECKLPNHVCPINSNCVNTVGSYYCDCKSGFRRQHGSDKNCVDIDECQEIEGLCEQKCVNFWGSFRCTCNLGYEINLSDNRTCIDVNECEVHKAYKLCMGFCINIPGSYECSCPPGYELGIDKMSCRDIDECAKPNVCSGQDEICTNIRGSYRCNTIQCPYGYSQDSDQKNRCRLINHLCEGEDCYQKPSTYTYNYITLVSNMLIPPQGRTLFTLRGPSYYDNIDFDLKIANVDSQGHIARANEKHFSTIKNRNQVQLNLMRSLEGPQDIELELSMTVFVGGEPRGKSVAVIFIIVSQYDF